MKLNRKGKIAEFYKFFLKDGEQLPDNFCTYFWGLVGRVLFMLLMPGQIVGWAVYGLFLLAKFAWTHRLLTLKAVAVAIIMTLVILICVYLHKRRKRLRFEFLDEVKAIAATKIDSVKNRYCPRIEWVESRDK